MKYLGSNESIKKVLSVVPFQRLLAHAHELAADLRTLALTQRLDGVHIHLRHLDAHLPLNRHTITTAATAARCTVRTEVSIERLGIIAASRRTAGSQHTADAQCSQG